MAAPSLNAYKHCPSAGPEPQPAGGAAAGAQRGVQPAGAGGGGQLLPPHPAGVLLALVCLGCWWLLLQVCCHLSNTLGDLPTSTRLALHCAGAGAAAARGGCGPVAQGKPPSNQDVHCPAVPAVLQVLAQLPHLEDADLSFNIYMEAAASLAPLTADGGLAALRRLDLRCGLRLGSDLCISRCWDRQAAAWPRCAASTLGAGAACEEGIASRAAHCTVWLHTGCCSAVCPWRLL